MSESLIQPICAFDVQPGGAVEPIAVPLPALPSAGYRWVHCDLADPALREWAAGVMPDAAARALMQSETRPRCDRLGDGLILNLRGVNMNPGADPEDMVSLRMWVTADLIVTARRRKVLALDAIRQEMVAGRAPATVGAFLAELTYGLSKRIETVSLELEAHTDEAEEAVLSHEPVAVADIAALRQSVIKMRRFVNPQREALDTLANWSGPLIAPETLILIRETSNRARRSVEELDATRERLAAIQDHIDAERALALSRNSYVLSVVAAIFLPLGFLTGLFGVNVGGMPGVDAPYAFWALTLASVVVGAALYLVFRLARWL